MRSILPRGSLFRFWPGFLEDFLRFPIAISGGCVKGYPRDMGVTCHLRPHIPHITCAARSCDDTSTLHVIRRVWMLECADAPRDPDFHSLHPSDGHSSHYIQS
jgi:hypothetical protein